MKKMSNYDQNERIRLIANYLNKHKKAVKADKELLFYNDERTLEMTVGHVNRSGRIYFQVLFNGAFIKVTKTWAPIEKEVLRLCTKHELKPEWSGLEGISFLRAAVRWFDDRIESNEDKSPSELLEDYKIFADHYGIVYK